MAKKWAASFYHSLKWRACRNSYIMHRMQIDGGLCEVCGLEVGYIVHHVRELDEASIHDPEIALNWDNLRYECKSCHDAEPGHWLDSKGYAKPLAKFGPDGQPVDVRRF